MLQLMVSEGETEEAEKLLKKVETLLYFGGPNDKANIIKNCKYHNSQCNIIYSRQVYQNSKAKIQKNSIFIITEINK